VAAVAGVAAASRRKRQSARLAAPALPLGPQQDYPRKVAKHFPRSRGWSEKPTPFSFS
jgi:hypothetical protein